MTIKYPTDKAGARRRHQFSVLSLVTGIIGLFAIPQSLPAADKLIGIHSARVLSQSMLGSHRKPGFSRNTISISISFSSLPHPLLRCMLGGDAEISLGGGEGPIRAYVRVCRRI